MAEFTAFNGQVEVNRRTVMAIVNSIAFGGDVRARILKKNAIDIDEGAWYPQQYFLNAFKEISLSLGELHLFLIGNAIIDNAEFPEMKGLEEALQSIDIAYHMNHRLNGEVMYNLKTGLITGGIGNYRLEDFDCNRRRAIMVCDNPYPSKFDEGIIAQVVHRFKADGPGERIEIDSSKECRTRGGDSCTYLIGW